jgi:hypothetical protein
VRPLPEREKRAEQYAQKAMVLLKRATSASHFRNPANVAHLDMDADLTFLRDRDEYKTFRASLEAVK